MAIGPIDYLGAVPPQDFVRSIQGGLQLGSMLRQNQMQQEAQQLAIAQQQQYQRDVQTAMKSPSPQAFAQLAMMYPQHREAFKQGWDQLNTDQQQNEIRDTTTLAAALHSGRPDVALSKLDDRIQAMKNSGQDTAQLQFLRDRVQQDPAGAYGSVLHVLSGLPGGDKALENLGRIGQENRANQLQPSTVAKADAEARIKGIEADNAPEAAALGNANLRSQVWERAARLGLDKDKLKSEYEWKLYELGQKGGTLDDGARKIVNDSTANAVSADQSSGQMLSLADRLEQSSASSGLTAKGAELYKSITGNQDAITQLRQEYLRLRNAQAVKMLPPGPATDKDIEMALKGFPSETSDAAQMASFLRGMAKLSQREAVVENAKAEWVNAVGHLGKPKTDIQIDGVKVPAGSTFSDFAKKFFDTKTQQKAAEQSLQQVQGRGYMRFAQPQPAANPMQGVLPVTGGM